MIGDFFMSKIKWLIVLYIAANIAHPVVYPIINTVSQQYGSLYVDLIIGVLMGFMLGGALYWLMRDLILSFWVWTLSTMVAYGAGVVLSEYLTLTLRLPLPNGLLDGLLVGILVGGVQSLMLPWFSKLRWIIANVLGFVVGNVLSYSAGHILSYFIGYLWMDLPPNAVVLMPGMIGLGVGCATLFVYCKSQFGVRYG